VLSLSSVLEDEQTIEMLVTAKAYPTVSTKYTEAVCVAGIRLDSEEPAWVRLFPVLFRDLPKHQQFGKYQHVRLRVGRHGSDRRVETWRPVLETIELGSVVPAGGAWAARRKLIEHMLGPTMCELNRGRQGGGAGPSLGIVQPKLIKGISIEREDAWSDSQRAIQAQGNFFTKKPALVKPAQRFNYKYICHEPDCKGHEQKIVDWELGEVYRRWPHRDDADLEEQIKSRWLTEMCAEDRETMFFVGDQHRWPGQFLVLGTFWPEYAQAEAQASLF
jgi:hypothetical protein